MEEKRLSMNSATQLITKLETRLEALETESKKLTKQKSFLEKQVDTLVSGQQCMQQMLMALVEKNLTSSIQTPAQKSFVRHSNVALYVYKRNNCTNIVESYLQEKFGTRLKPYDSSYTYELVIVLFHRSSATLDKIMHAQELQSFNSMLLLCLMR
jgi:hypothetical protein